MVIDELVIALNADTRGLERGFQRVKSMLANLGLFVGAKALFDGWRQGAEQLDSLSRQTGESVRTLDAWGAAAERAGGNAAAVWNQMKSLNQQLWLASRTGNAQILPYLHLLGIRARDASGGLKTASDLLPEIADRIQGMDARRSNNLLRKMGFDEDTILLLQQGGDALRSVVSDMRATALTGEDAKKARELNTALHDLKRNISAIAALIFREAAPAIARILVLAKSLLAFLREHPRAVLAAVAVIVTAINTRLIPAILGIARALLLTPLGWLSMAVSGLILLLEDLWTYMQGGAAALPGLWEMLGSPAEIKAGLSAFWLDLKKMWEDFRRLWQEKGFWGAVLQRAAEVMDALWGIMKARFIEFWNWMMEAIGFSSLKIQGPATRPDEHGIIPNPGNTLDFLKNRWEHGQGDVLGGFFNAISNFFTGNQNAAPLLLLPREGRPEVNIDVGGVTIHTESQDGTRIGRDFLGSLRSNAQPYMADDFFNPWGMSSLSYPAQSGNNQK